MSQRSIDDKWNLRTDTIYLNNGSFGPQPNPVLEARIELIRRFASQPMDELTRQLEPQMRGVCTALAKLMGTDPDSMALVPNATTGMNIVANNFTLNPGDEVLLNDHEYGAVVRIWGRRCQAAGARIILVRLPRPLTHPDEIVNALFAAVTERTRLIVVSQVTSPTATIFPIQAICQRARSAGIPVCVDGPHAVAMLPVRLDELGCDYYTASCHKWLCAPLGTGFLWVKRKYKQGLTPVVLSWGRSLSGQPPVWQDEFHWPGTFDPTGFLAVPAAIQFLTDTGFAKFRETTHALAQLARQRIVELTGAAPLIPDDPAWYGSMVTLPLPKVLPVTAPPGTPHPLQARLWTEYGIEVPIIEWHGAISIRISCHLYNSAEDIDSLLVALKRCDAI